MSKQKKQQEWAFFFSFFLGFLDACGVESKHAGNFRGKTRTTEATIDPAQLGHHILAFWKDLPRASTRMFRLQSEEDQLPNTQ